MATWQYVTDAVMSFLWILVYVLVLISSLKNKKPFMPPLACSVIFPWEFVATIRMITHVHSVNYALFARIGFTLLDLSIILVLVFKLKYYNNRKKQSLYILWVIFVFVCMWFVFDVRNGQIYTSFLNTIIGVCIWLFYSMSNVHCATKLNLSIVVIKFIADAFGFVSYYHMNAIVFVESLILPMIDLLHIIIVAYMCVKKKPVLLFDFSSKKNNKTQKLKQKK